MNPICCWITSNLVLFCIFCSCMLVAFGCFLFSSLSRKKDLDINDTTRSDETEQKDFSLYTVPIAECLVTSTQIHLSKEYINFHFKDRTGKKKSNKIAGLHFVPRLR